MLDKSCSKLNYGSKNAHIQDVPLSFKQILTAVKTFIYLQITREPSKIKIGGVRQSCPRFNRDFKNAHVQGVPKSFGQKTETSNCDLSTKNHRQAT